MDERTKVFIAQTYLNRKTAREYCDWAVESLEKGIDTKNIRILSSMFTGDYDYEVEAYFRKGLKDLGWEFPSENDSCKWYSELIANQIISEEIEPIEGCKIMNEFYYSSLPDKDYSRWNSLFWLLGELSKDELNLLIRKEAKAFLDGYPIIYPDSIEEKSLFELEQQNDSFFSRIRKLFS